MAERPRVSVAISNGNGTDFVITPSTQNDCIGVMRYDGEYINLGVLTNKRLDGLIENLERLRCHCQC